VLDDLVGDFVVYRVDFVDLEDFDGIFVRDFAVRRVLDG